MLRRISLSAIAVLAATPALADTVLVTSGANDGAGSLRAALATASASEAGAIIVIDTPGDISISETLVYEGTAPLSIIGADHKVRTDQNVTLLAVPNGADLDVTGVSFSGPGGFDISERDAGTAGKGVFIGVPADTSGTVSLRLDGVVVDGVAGHGIHVSDCDLADDCGGGGGDETPPYVPADPTVNDVGTTTDVGGDDTSTHVVTVTGTGEPGDTVDVTAGDQSGTVTIGDDGVWEIDFEGDTFPGDGTVETEAEFTEFPRAL